MITIYEFFKLPIIRLIIDICTLVGGLSGFIYLFSIIKESLRSFGAIYSKILSVFLFFTIPILGIAGGYSLYQTFGGNRVAIFILGFMYICIQYLVPSVMNTFIKSGDRLLVVMFSVICIPLGLSCAFMLFSAGYYAIEYLELPLSDINIFLFYGALQVLCIIGISQMIVIELKQRKVSNN